MTEGRDAMVAKLAARWAAFMIAGAEWDGTAEMRERLDAESDALGADLNAMYARIPEEEWGEIDKVIVDAGRRLWKAKMSAYSAKAAKAQRRLFT